MLNIIDKICNFFINETKILAKNPEELIYLRDTLLVNIFARHIKYLCSVSSKTDDEILKISINDVKEAFKLIKGSENENIH